MTLERAVFWGLILLGGGLGFAVGGLGGAILGLVMASAIFAAIEDAIPELAEAALMVVLVPVIVAGVIFFWYLVAQLWGVGL